MKPYYDYGGITIYHGDCRGVLPQLDASKLAAMVTDPPYGIAYKSNHDSILDRSIQGDADTKLRDEVLEWWRGRPSLIFGTWRRAIPKDTRATLIWDQRGALGMGALDLPWKPSWQEIYVIGKGFQGRRDSAVLSFAPVQSIASNGRAHPHEKPISLMLELIRKCPEGAILDPFMGSGTTLRAAKDLGRKAIGIEIEEKYCEIAAKRLAQEVLF